MNYINARCLIFTINMFFFIMNNSVVLICTSSFPSRREETRSVPFSQPVFGHICFYLLVLLLSPDFMQQSHPTSAAANRSSHMTC